MYIYNDLITVMRYVSAAMRKTERKNIVSIIYSITQAECSFAKFAISKTHFTSVKIAFSIRDSGDIRCMTTGLGTDLLEGIISPEATIKALTNCSVVETLTWSIRKS